MPPPCHHTREGFGRSPVRGGGIPGGFRRDVSYFRLSGAPEILGVADLRSRADLLKYTGIRCPPISPDNPQ